MEQFIHDAIDCEIQWLLSYANPHAKDNPLYRSERDNDPQEHIKLLEKYSSVVELFIPKDEYSAFKLWPSNLHLSDLLLGPANGSPRLDVAGIIDWHGITSDLFL